MLIAQTLGRRETDPFDNRSVVQRIPDDVVFTPQEAGDDTEVDLEARGEDDCIFLTREGSQLFLECEVRVERTIEESTPSAARTIFLCRSDSCSLDLGVIRQPEVRV